MGIPHKPGAEPIPAPQTAEQHIQSVFGTVANTMTAIAYAESKMDPNAVNYNCIYTIVVEKDGVTTPVKKSMQCKPGDRAKAWSVDCGLMQINTKGKLCPADLLDPATNVARAREIYDQQGLDAWVVYSSKAYKSYLHEKTPG